MNHFIILYRYKVGGLYSSTEKPSVRTFLVICISAMAAWIDVRLARRDSYVFWPDQVYFSKSFSFLTRVPYRYLCRSRQPLITAIQCTVGKALDFDTLGRWLGI